MSMIQLPPSTIKLITSTQIITSVSSVVKELMENALDAGATNIDVKLENSGLDLIEVKDDGCGIKKSDVPNMALPSYTSKICDFSDLENLKSYGFRGEALSALCGVADVSITTRIAEDEFAVTYTLNNTGNIVTTKPSHLSKGTLVTAKNLFKYLPVRKQYLSSGRRKTEELKRADSVVKSLAVIHPGLRVTFCHNRCLLWQKSACASLRQSLMQVVTHFVAVKLEELSLLEPEVSIQMLVPKKDTDDLGPLCQSNNECMMIYVNTRPVRYKKLEKMVLKCLSKCFPGQLPLHKYPNFLISITTAPGETDVNLEPNKTRVLLRQEDEVLSKVEEFLQKYYGIMERREEPVNSAPIADKIDSEHKPAPCKRMRVDTETAEIASLRKEEAICVRNNEASGTADIEADRDRDVPGVSVHKQSAGVTSGTEPEIELNGRSSENSESHALSAQNECEQSYGIGCELSSESRLQHETHMVEDVNVDRLNGEIQGHRMISTQEIIREIDCMDDLNFLKSDLLNEFAPSDDSVVSEKNSVYKEEESSFSKTGMTENEDLFEITDRAMEKWSNGALKPHFGNDAQERKEPERQVLPSAQRIGNDCEVVLESTKRLQEQWSMGMLKSHNGVQMQGSAVLLPQVTVDSFNSSYQSVSSQMGQKEQSAFTKFSRDERPKILKEHPGIAFTKVGEMLVQRWQALPQEQRYKYEVLAKELDDKRKKSSSTETGVQKISSMLKRQSSPNKQSEPKAKSKSPKKITGQQTEEQKKVWKRPQRKKQMLKVSMQIIKELCEREYNPSQSSLADIELIGQLKPRGEWVYRRHKELGMIRHWGLQESVLYHRMLAEHSVPLRKLDVKIPVEESQLGPDLWKVLQSLNKAYDVMTNTVIITSDVITKNGFKIEISEGRSTCMINEIASTINFYGILDLKEILRLVKDHGPDSLANCRTMRIISYIRDEAVRIVRRCSASLERETMKDLVSYWQANLTHLGSSCLHKTPIFHPLKDMCKLES